MAARRVLVSVVAALLVVPAWGPAPARAQETTRLSYSIREARAYAYRVSLSKEVIEAAQTLQPCDPEEDPYGCDDAAYEHEPNCPAEIAIGPSKPAPDPAPAEGAGSVSGGAGDAVGPSVRPPLASPITLNEQLTLGFLSRLGQVVEAGGLATDGYVDLSGRQEPAAHTESDAFSPNRATYEERCVPPDDTEEYAHYLSRSSVQPETYHLAECREGECTFGGIGFASESERGRTIVHLYERDGRVHALLKSSLHDIVWAGGALEAELLDTTVRMSSDGTEDGLEYSVSTAAVGVRLNGEPVFLPPGEAVEIPGGIQVGLAAPYVAPADNGRAIEIVAAGFYIASDRQTVLFGGTELRATMGREPILDTGAGDGGDGVAVGDTTPGGSGVSTGLGGSSPTAGPAASPTPGTAPAPPDPELVVARVRTGGWIVPLALAGAAVAALLLLVRWMGRYAWGRRLYRAQPFRSIDWIYRAFVKT